MEILTTAIGDNAILQLTLDGPETTSIGMIELRDPAHLKGTPVAVPFVIQTETEAEQTFSSDQILAAAHAELQKSGYNLIPTRVTRLMR
jgi:hypothetical protein